MSVSVREKQRKRERERERERQTDRQTDRQRKRERKTSAVGLVRYDKGRNVIFVLALGVVETKNSTVGYIPMRRDETRDERKREEAMNIDAKRKEGMKGDANSREDMKGDDRSVENKCEETGRDEKR